MNLEELTDDELDQLRVDVLNEQERRANLLRIPGQMSDLIDKYVQGVGDKADLKGILDEQATAL